MRDPAGGHDDLVSCGRSTNIDACSIHKPRFPPWPARPIAPSRNASHLYGIDAGDKLKVLSVTGGVPRYLEEIDPGLTADENIRQMCFRSEGVRFREAELLHVGRTLILDAAPYVQKATARKKGCQVDLLIATKHSLCVSHGTGLCGTLGQRR